MPTDTVAGILQTAMSYHQAGRLEQAETLYRQILAHNPNHADALHLLGVLAFQSNDDETAVELIQRAIAIKGEWLEACIHLGQALQRSEQFEQAISIFRRAIALEPNFAGTYYFLGTVLQTVGQRDRAIAAYRQAIALNPEDAASLVNLGIALQTTSRLDEAIEAERSAIAINPNLADAYFHLGNMLRDKGEITQAIEAFGKTIALESSRFQSHVQLAVALWESGQIDAAIAAMEWAIALNPDDAEVHWSYAQLLLLRGDFSRGWPEFQWRWRRNKLPWPKRNFTQPLWDGSELNGRTILLHSEGSCSDTIQFMRYIPLVIQRGGKVIVECQPGVRRLLEENYKIEQWISPGESLPQFDVFFPLLNLPWILGTTVETIPASAPSWHIARKDSEVWRRKIVPDDARFKVGLAWAGSPSQLQDCKRSISLAYLAPLAKIEGIVFFSLQKGRAAGQSQSPPDGMQLRNFTEDLADFADTAALISQLDLVISVDTAVAHLAGAMGKQVWTLLPFIPDWRWMLHRADSPWYPTMRLFRQSSPGNWDTPIRNIAAELSKFAKSAR